MKKRTSLTVVLLQCLMVIGFAVNGNSQQNPDTLQKPEIEKPSATTPRRQAIGLQVVADLGVSPLTYTGPCPAIFTFKGQISVNRPTTVSYKFIRSDGVHTEIETLAFDKPGRKEVSTTWQVGDPGAPSPFRGVVEMQVIAPVNVKIRSNPAVFTCACTEPQGRTPAP